MTHRTGRSLLTIVGGFPRRNVESREFVNIASVLPIILIDLSHNMRYIYFLLKMKKIREILESISL